MANGQQRSLRDFVVTRFFRQTIENSLERRGNGLALVVEVTEASGANEGYGKIFIRRRLSDNRVFQDLVLKNDLLPQNKPAASWPRK